jgi:D-apionolactonase
VSGEELRAGALSATLVGADLLDVRWGSLDLASRMLVTVRDAEWGTVAPALRHRTIERSSDSFLVELDVVHDDGAIAFRWRGLIEGLADGTLTFAIDGAAERGFGYRRIGICILHPWRAYVDTAFEATTPDGYVAGTFPREIAPQTLRDGVYQPMVPAFSELRAHLRADTDVTFAFDGELFELEDQRNWTDASFKTYPTPVALSNPRPMSAGERVAQKLHVDAEGAPPPIVVVDDVTLVGIGDATGRLVPPIGTIDGMTGAAHITVSVDARTGDTSALHAAAALGVPLELEIIVDDQGSGVEALRKALLGLPFSRILIHLESGATIPGELVRAIRERLGTSVDGVPVVGGTSDFFSELNRHPPDGVFVDAIAFSISPTVHATDRRSIMATLESQSQVVRQARALSNGLPIVVSPVTLNEHVGTPFADAWTIGSVSSLAGAGAASLTYTHATPALAEVVALMGAEMLDVEVTPPGRVAALATAHALLVTNLTPVPQRFELAGIEQPALAPYEVRSAASS